MRSFKFEKWLEIQFQSWKLETEMAETDPMERETDRGIETDLWEGKCRGWWKAEKERMHRGKGERNRENLREQERRRDTEGTKWKGKIGIQYKKHEMQFQPLDSDFKSGERFPWCLAPLIWLFSIIIIFLFFTLFFSISPSDFSTHSCPFLF